MPTETPSAPAKQPKESTLFERTVATGQAGIEALNKGAGNVGTTISETATSITEHPMTKGALSTLEKRLNDLKAIVVSAFFGTAETAKKTSPAVKPTVAETTPSVAPTVKKPNTESSPLLASFTHLIETVIDFFENYTKNNPDSPITRLLQSTGIVDKVADVNQKAETAKNETLKAEIPEVKAPKTEVLKVETPPSETPKAEAPKVETLKTEAPKTIPPAAVPEPEKKADLSIPPNLSFDELKKGVYIAGKKVSIAPPASIFVDGKKWQIIGKRGSADGATITIDNAQMKNGTLIVDVVGKKSYFTQNKKAVIPQTKVGALLNWLSNKEKPYQITNAEDEDTGADFVLVN